MIEYSLVQVEWEDITGNSEPWFTVQDALDLEPARMVTVGWLISDREGYITISSTLGDKEEASDINCIPKSVIKKMTIINEV